MHASPISMLHHIGGAHFVLGVTVLAAPEHTQCMKFFSE